MTAAFNALLRTCAVVSTGYIVSRRICTTTQTTWNKVTSIKLLGILSNSLPTTKAYAKDLRVRSSAKPTAIWTCSPCDSRKHHRESQYLFLFLFFSFFFCFFCHVIHFSLFSASLNRRRRQVPIQLNCIHTKYMIHHVVALYGHSTAPKLRSTPSGFRYFNFSDTI